jgi:hypothetical protein
MGKKTTTKKRERNNKKNRSKVGLGWGGFYKAGVTREELSDYFKE